MGIIGSCTAFFAAGVSAETYYYTGAQQSNSFVSHYEDWSTFNEEFQAYEVATGPIPIDEIGGAETILRRMDTIECLTKGQLAGIDSATAYVKSIIYETSQQLESGGADWQFYTNVNGGACDMSIGDILVDADIGSGNALKIRKRQADANFNLTVREGISVKSGQLHLGTTGSGEFLTSLTLGADSNGVVFDIDGTDAQVTDPTLRIVASEIFSLSSEFSDSPKSINITKGTLEFIKGVQGSSTVALTNQNADLPGTVINMGLASRFYYGQMISSMSGWIKLGDINISGTTTDTFGVSTNNDRARMYFYTTATEGSLPGSAPVQIGTITLDSGNPDNDLSRLDIYTNANAYIEKIVSANIGGDNSFQGIVLNSSSSNGSEKATITVGSMDIAVRRLTVNSNVVVEDDLVTFFHNPEDMSMATDVAIPSGSLTVKGNLIMKDGAGIRFDTDQAEGATVLATVGGISGGDGNRANRVTTSYGSAKNVQTLLAINGDFDSEFSGRLHDMGEMSSLESMQGRNYLSIQKDGSGTQILRGDNYYRGTTTVNSGTLYIRADGATRTDDGWGIGQIILNGGKFGAIGASGNIGEIRATDLTWSNASRIAVDFAADGTCDLISLTGDFLKASGDAGGQYTFEFSGSFAAGETEYLIISWESDSTVDFSEGDFSYEYSGTANLSDGHFVVKDDGLYFVAVPEPAEYAMIFGMLAIGFAFLKRRRK